MKLSENYRNFAWEAFVHSIIFLVLGCISLIATVLLAVLRVEIIPLLAVTGLCLLFFGASALSFFVDYPDFKDSQRIAEEGEFLREREQQRQLQQD